MRSKHCQLEACHVAPHNDAAVGTTRHDSGTISSAVHCSNLAGVDLIADLQGKVQHAKGIMLLPTQVRLCMLVKMCVKGVSNG